MPYKNLFTAVMKSHYLHPKDLEVKYSYGFVLDAVHELTINQEILLLTAWQTRSLLVGVRDVEVGSLAACS